MDAQLEDKFTLSRQTIFNLLQASSAFNPQVVKVFIDVFKDLPDCRQHGPIVWALMVKGEGVKRGVLGTHLKVYLQYYYHYLISASQRRECRRPLDIPSLAYLTAVAAFGFARGSTEFDKAFNNRDIEYINNLIIDRESFLKFFWDQSDDNFSFIHCWRLIDRLWDAWDIPAPVRIHGFVSSNLSERMLKARIGVIGAFLLRFSSKGGLAVDYVHEGKIKKTHWKFDELRDVNSLRARLYDSKRDGPFLLHLIDFTDAFSAKCYRKEDLFPAMHVESGYSDSGYTGDGYNVVDAMPIEDTTNKQFVGMNMKWT